MLFVLFLAISSYWIFVLYVILAQQNPFFNIYTSFYGKLFTFLRNAHFRIFHLNKINKEISGLFSQNYQKCLVFLVYFAQYICLVVHISFKWTRGFVWFGWFLWIVFLFVISYILSLILSSGSSRNLSIHLFLQYVSVIMYNNSTFIQLFVFYYFSSITICNCMKTSSFHILWLLHKATVWNPFLFGSYRGFNLFFKVKFVAFTTTE